MALPGARILALYTALIALPLAEGEAATAFIRGDCDGNGSASDGPTDAIFLLRYLFLGGAAPRCLAACDANDDDAEILHVSDAVFLLRAMYLGSPSPPPPFPVCGEDPTPGGLECRSYPACPQPPVPVFRFTPLVGEAPALVTFDATGSFDPDGSVASYAWDFGDGTTGNGLRANHRYLGAGGYSVTLAVTDRSGASASLSKTFHVVADDHDPRFDTVVAAVREEMARSGAPGAAVAIVEAGQVTFAKGFGSKHPELSDPVEPTTLFRIGSVTKVLTAIGLLRSVQNGAVRLDAPITDVLPGFAFARDASWAPSLTAEHLLTHTGAIRDWFEIDGPSHGHDGALSEYLLGPYGSEEFAYLMAPPGRMFNYTNAGFLLGGLIAEVAAGRPYRRLVTDDVLAPLGMRRTFFRPDDVVSDGDFATGILGAMRPSYPDLPEVLHPEAYESAVSRPAGYAFSSALDLARLAAFLDEGDPDVLDDAILRAMESPRVDTEMAADLLGYGYGLFVQSGGFLSLTTTDFHRLRIIYHGGDVPGFSADVFCVPDLDFAFVALTNASIAHLQRSFVVALNALRTLPAPSTPPDLGVDPVADPPRYAGEYRDPFIVGRVVIRRAGSELRLALPDIEDLGGQEFVLAPSLKHNYLLTIGETVIPITFILDPDDGQAEYVRTRGFVAHREPEGGAGATLRPPGTRSVAPLLRILRAEPEPFPAFLVRPPAAR